METVNVVARTEMAAMEKMIPAVLYGKSMGSKSIFVKVAQQAAMHWHEGSKFSLKFDGDTYRGTLEEIQKDSIGTRVKHLSFHVVDKNEITKVEVPVVTTSMDKVAKGGIITIMLNHVTIKGTLKNLPEELTIDVAGMELNESKSLADITLPKNVEFAMGGDMDLHDATVVVCKPAKTVDVGEAAETEATETTTAI